VKNSKHYVYTSLLIVFATASALFNFEQMYISGSALIIGCLGIDELIKRQRVSRTERMKLFSSLVKPIYQLIILSGLVLNSLIPRYIVLFVVAAKLLEMYIAESVFHITKQSIAPVFTERNWVLLAGLIAATSVYASDALFWGSLVLGGLSLYNLAKIFYRALRS